MCPEKKPCILVVDDEPSILATLSEFLTMLDYEVVSAVNGVDAIQKAADKKLDMALIDMAMPILNGMQTLQELKKTQPQCIFIMITAYRDAEKVVEAFNLGASDCIFKPFDLQAIRQNIKDKLSA